MRGVRIPQDLNGEDKFILGLSVPRLAALLLGLLAAYTILHLSLPAPVQLIGATLASLVGAIIAWVRPEGRSLIHWLVAAIEFKFSREPVEPMRRSPQPTVAPQRRSEEQPPRRTQRLKLITSPDKNGPETAVALARTADTRAVSGLVPEQVSAARSPESAWSGGPDDDVIELPDAPQAEEATTRDGRVDRPGSAPVYLGGPQVITFFSTKGGTGRTTLATEVAVLLATKGFYRESPTGQAERLRVALIDFDRSSANVSARIGLAQPTMLDFLCEVGAHSPDPRDFAIRHAASNLDVLLGPSKCLAGDRSELLSVAHAAHVLSSFKQAGYQFLVLDMSASLGDLETYLLEAANRIYCVVTPTAGSVQSLYRGVEALRRLGLGAKLQYVGNKMREGANLSEAMGDLNGSLAASIPFDPTFDSAENHHQPLALGHRGTAVNALIDLATSIYPALQEPLRQHPTVSPFGWFGRRRRAG